MNPQWNQDILAYVNKLPIADSFQRALAFKRQAQLHPVKYVYALARAFQKAGGTILENCFVKDVSQKQILEVETTQGILQSEIIIYPPIFTRKKPASSSLCAIQELCHGC